MTLLTERTGRCCVSVSAVRRSIINGMASASAAAKQLIGFASINSHNGMIQLRSFLARHTPGSLFALNVVDNRLTGRFGPRQRAFGLWCSYRLPPSGDVPVLPDAADITACVVLDSGFHFFAPADTPNDIIPLLQSGWFFGRSVRAGSADSAGSGGTSNKTDPTETQQKQPPPPPPPPPAAERVKFSIAGTAVGILGVLQSCVWRANDRIEGSASAASDGIELTRSRRFRIELSNREPNRHYALLDIAKNFRRFSLADCQSLPANKNDKLVLTRLELADAELIDRTWAYHTPNTSINYVRHIIQHYPGFGIRIEKKGGSGSGSGSGESGGSGGSGSGSELVSWAVRTNYGGIGLGHTLKPYRGRALQAPILSAHVDHRRAEASYHSPPEGSLFAAYETEETRALPRALSQSFMYTAPTNTATNANFPRLGFTHVGDVEWCIATIVDVDDSTTTTTTTTDKLTSKL